MDNKFEEVYRKVAETNVQPFPNTQQTIKVELCGDGSLMDKFAAVEYSAIQAHIQSKGGMIPFDDDKFKRYCRTYIQSRVGWSTGKPYIIHPLEKVICPAFISTVCMNIGIAVDVSLGITLTPVMKETGATIPEGASREETLIAMYDVLSLDEVKAISLFLRSIPEYHGSLGYLKDKSGIFDFMSMQLIDGIISHHDAKAHPVYALMASVVGPHLVASALSPLVRYGDSAFLSNLLWEVTSV